VILSYKFRFRYRVHFLYFWLTILSLAVEVAVYFIGISIGDFYKVLNGRDSYGFYRLVAKVLMMQILASVVSFAGAMKGNYDMKSVQKRERL
jgi:hypothetical protein